VIHPGANVLPLRRRHHRGRGSTPTRAPPTLRAADGEDGEGAGRPKKALAPRATRLAGPSRLEKRRGRGAPGTGELLASVAGRAHEGPRQSKRATMYSNPIGMNGHGAGT